MKLSWLTNIGSRANLCQNETISGDENTLRFISQLYENMFEWPSCFTKVVFMKYWRSNGPQGTQEQAALTGKRDKAVDLRVVGVQKAYPAHFTFF